MRKFFCIGLLLLSLTSRAQKKEPVGSRWSATLTGAITSLPGANIGIQPGVGYRITKHFATLTEFTIPTGARLNKDETVTNTKFFRIQEEVRYCFSQKRHSGYTYTGIRFSYSTRKFHDPDQGFYSSSQNDNDGFFYDAANVSSPVFTTSFQFGTLFFINDNFGLDFFCGLGGRFSNTHYADVINKTPGTRIRPVDGSNIYASYSFEGKGSYVHVNTGFRLLWRFGQ